MGYRSALGSVRVDHDLMNPSVCEVRIEDPGRKAISDCRLALGELIEVEASPVTDGDNVVLFRGAIHAIDVDFGPDGQIVAVYAYDESFVLAQHRYSQSFNDVTVADVIGEIAERVGLSVGTLDVDTTVRSHLALVNETPRDFIWRHAAEVGAFVRCEDGEIHVLVPTPAADAPEPGDFESRDPLQLVPGHNVIRLNLHTSTSRQVAKVECRGWDPVDKIALVARVNGGSDLIDVEPAPADVGERWGTPVLIEPSPVWREQTQCDRQAAALGGMIATQQRRAEGEAIGHPALEAGAVVSIGPLGPLDGRYLLTHTRHLFDTDGYVTEFRCSGLADLSLAALVESPPLQQLSGLYPALVADIADPESLARVRLALPWLDEAFETDWARVAQIGAGEDRGLLWFPEVDDEVVVAFVDGDPNTPIVLGGLYNGVDTAPLGTFVDPDAGTVVRRGIRTRSGHQIVLIDTEGEEAIEITSGDEKTSIVLDQGNGEIAIKSDGQIQIISDRKLKMKAGGDVAISARGALSLKSVGDASIESDANLELIAGGQVNVSGAVINLN